MRWWFGCFLVGAAAAALSGCIAPEGPSISLNRPDRTVGPSSQRLDASGYPLLGAYPGQAADQLDNTAVAADRASLAAAGAAQNAELRSASAEYQKSLAEAAAIKQRHEANVSQLSAPRQKPAAGKQANDDVLREIEGR